MDGQHRRSPFLEEVRRAVRVRHYSIRTEKTYLHWIKRYILFHGKRHPSEMRETEVAEFLSHLAISRRVSASTQNQALNALVFLYRVVLERPLESIEGIVRAKRPQRLPVVLDPGEVRRILTCLEGAHWLAACLMYGSGLRLMECLRLRVMDIDFSHRAIIVRHGKGGKDRVVTLPDDLIQPLQRHLHSVKLVHEKDLADGYGEFRSPTHSRESTPMLRRSGDGNTCFRHPHVARIRLLAGSSATTCTRRPFSER